MRLPTYFLSHGGGPWPWLGGPFRRTFDKLEASLKDIPRQLPEQPKAILMATGHWETPAFTLSSGEHPPMIYDYGGFPPETYTIRYDAPGSPELSHRAQALLQGGGIQTREDSQRGFDHGTFSVMKAIWPDADMPVVQLSMKIGFDPAAHIEAGRSLAPLRDEGVLILGSGLSYHNLGLMDPRGAAPSRQFDAWLNETLVSGPPSERSARLERWSEAPAARIAHPREDHLLPLMVAAGAAEGEPATLIYHEDAFFGAIAASSFRFG